MEKIRTLGLYQPYASLMLHGKIETRWVEDGRKPPFPLGKYLIYSTKKSSSILSFQLTSGKYCQKVWQTLQDGDTYAGDGLPICIAILEGLWKYRPDIDGPETFVDSFDGKMQIIKGTHRIPRDYTLWCLKFVNVQPVKLFRFNGGKQGIGFLSEADQAKIKYL
jgi:hypothetical protein